MSRRWSSSRICLKYVRNLTHSSVAYISASAVLRAVTVWRLLIQWTGPPNHRIYPDKDLDLKMSNDVCVVGCRLLDWSWGPQLASVMEYSFDSSSGNLTYDWMDVLVVVVNDIPMVRVPLR